MVKPPPTSNLCRRWKSLGVSLQTFRRWYHQAGTPQLSLQAVWDPAAGELMTLSQLTRAWAKREAARADSVRLGVLDASGQQLQERLLVLEQAEQSWTLSGLPAESSRQCCRAA